ETAPSLAMQAEPLHPYSQGLLLSEPPADHRVRELVAIPGSVPAADEVAGSCVFAPRRRWAQARCREAVPPLRERGPGREEACLRIEEIEAEMSSLRGRAEADAHPPVPDRVSAPLIRVRDVEKEFQSGKRTVRALQGASIEIGPGESVGIVGESGSGKTTLGRM